MSLNLPEPDALDVWGEQLNAAIEVVNTKAETAQAEVDALEALVGDPEDLSGFVLQSQLGVANGVATLDGAGSISAGQFGNITPTSIGAADVVHQHSLADLPAVNLALNSTLGVIIFNADEETWAARTTVTASSTRSIMYIGDADLPDDALPDVDIHLKLKTSGATVPNPVPPPPATTDPDANGVALGIPAVTVNGSAYSITGTATTTTSKTFTYLQLAVRDPAGLGYDTAFNNGRNINNTTYTLTGSGTAAVTGNWTVAVAYSLDGTTWVNGPVTTFNIATLGGVPSGGAVPILGLSGKTWNSGVCDASNGNLTACNAFGTWRGAANDAIMVFPGRGSWDAMYWIPDSLNSFPGYRVIALPTQPQYLGNTGGVGADADAFWTQYGLNLKNRGWDDGRTILRLNWEANGNWYAWSWDRGGGATAFVNAFKNAVNKVRLNAPTVKFDLCVNRGSVGGGVNWKTQIVDPLIGWVDIIGLDAYDFSSPSLNQPQFDAMAAQDPSLDTVAAHCILRGLKMSVDEWGGASTVGPYIGGGDNPFYITAMRTWFSAHANNPLVLDMYFNINADGLNQRLYPVSESSKPNAGVRYQSEF